MYIISGNYNVQKNQGSVNETSAPEDGAKELRNAPSGVRVKV
jgi:hypothetical protein